MAPKKQPAFDLIVATVDRTAELDRLLASLDGQTSDTFRVIVVDQNDHGRLGPTLARHPSLDLLRLRSEPGLSRARNVGLRHVEADFVAFPDDDCAFPSDLLERVARRFEVEPALDGLTGRAADDTGRSSRAWALEAGPLTRENLWNRAISFTIFLRREVVDRVGEFDERLGLGAGGALSSGEETEYLVRALDSGARIEYDPSLIVLHRDKTLSPAALSALATREGASLGYILRKHRYPVRTVGRMLARPLGGALLALARRDRDSVRFHLSTLRGRVLGYRS